MVRGTAWCAAKNCGNSRAKCPTLTFFSFPKKDLERGKIWIRNTRRLDIQKASSDNLCKRGFVLCEKHFEDSQFMNANVLKKRLIWNAVPTLFDVPNPPPRIASKRPPPKDRSTIVVEKKKTKTDPLLPEKPTAEPGKIEIESKTADSALPGNKPLMLVTPLTSTTSMMPVNTLTTAASLLPTKPLMPVIPLIPIKRGKLQQTPREERLMKLLKQKRVTISRMKKRLEMRPPTVTPKKEKAELLRLSQKYLPTPIHQFVSLQLQRLEKSKLGMRYTEADKDVALGLYFQNPKAYKACQDLLQLPSIETLRRLCRRRKKKANTAQEIEKEPILPNDKVEEVIPHENVTISHA